MMWGYFNGVYAMDPAWLEYWNWKYYMLEQMSLMKPPHVTEEARAFYYTYVSDQMRYIYSYIYPGQFQDYAVYQTHLQAYRESNPEGAKVFDKQEAYLEKQLFSDPNNKNKQTKVPQR